MHAAERLPASTSSFHIHSVLVVFEEGDDDEDAVSEVHGMEAAAAGDEAPMRTGDDEQKKMNEWIRAFFADEIAAEHVNLAVEDPDAWLPRLRNGGEFFLGDQTPVAAGDYYAGPSHCLPTGTSARFASGISVYTFLKRSGTVHYRDGMPQEAIDAVARLAELEGLDAHATSARIRARDRSRD